MSEESQISDRQSDFLSLKFICFSAHILLTELQTQLKMNSETYVIIGDVTKCCQSHLLLVSQRIFDTLPEPHEEHVVMIPGEGRIPGSYCHIVIHWSLIALTPLCTSNTLWWLSPHSPDTRVWFIVRLIPAFIARHDHLEVNKVRIYNPSPAQRKYLPWSSFPARSMPMI